MSTTFTSGVRVEVTARGTREALEAWERATHGFTVVKLKCATCGDVAFRQTLGDAR